MDNCEAMVGPRVIPMIRAGCDLTRGAECWRMIRITRAIAMIETGITIKLRDTFRTALYEGDE